VTPVPQVGIVSDLPGAVFLEAGPDRHRLKTRSTEIAEGTGYLAETGLIPSRHIWQGKPGGIRAGPGPIGRCCRHQGLLSLTPGLPKKTAPPPWSGPLRRSTLRPPCLLPLLYLELCKEQAERLGGNNFFDHAACQYVILCLSGCLIGINWNFFR